jgi:hypothetical protein
MQVQDKKSLLKKQLSGILTLFPVAHVVMQQELRENTNITHFFFT